MAIINLIKLEEFEGELLPFDMVLVDTELSDEGYFALQEQRQADKRPRSSRSECVPNVLRSVYAELATITIPAATALVGVWLQANFGRKIRVKVGDIEAEAGSVEEVKQLLERAIILADRKKQS